MISKLHDNLPTLLFISPALLLFSLSYFFAWYFHFKKKIKVILIENYARMLLLFFIIVLTPIILLAKLITVKNTWMLSHDNYLVYGIDVWYFELLCLTRDIFLITALLILPIGVVYIVIYGKRIFNKEIAKLSNAKCDAKGEIFSEVNAILNECINIANIKSSFEIIIIPELIINSFQLSHCAMFKIKTKFFLILSGTILLKYKEGDLTKEDLMALFSHEISHIRHYDTYFPVWIKQFLKSRLLLISLILLYVQFAIQLFLIISRTGLDGFKIILFLKFIIFVTVIISVIGILVWRILIATIVEREHLADIETSFVLGSTETIINLLNRIRRPTTLVTEHWYDKIRLFFPIDIKWSPSRSRRMRKLELLRDALTKKEIFPDAHFKYTPLTAFIVNLFVLTFVVLNPLSIDLDHGITNNVFVCAFFIANFGLLIVNLSPLRSIDTEIFFGHFAADNGPYLTDIKMILFSKGWLRIHLNNLMVTVIMLLTLGIITGFKGIMKIRFINFYGPFLILTVFTVLYYYLIWMEQLDEQRKKQSR